MGPSLNSDASAHTFITTGAVRGCRRNSCRIVRNGQTAITAEMGGNYGGKCTARSVVFGKLRARRAPGRQRVRRYAAGSQRSVIRSGDGERRSLARLGPPARSARRGTAAKLGVPREVTNRRSAATIVRRAARQPVGGIPLRRFGLIHLSKSLRPAARPVRRRLRPSMGSIQEL